MPLDGGRIVSAVESGAVNWASAILGKNIALLGMLSEMTRSQRLPRLGFRQ
jgi:hypothetical protein